MTSLASPGQSGFRMPAEWEAHERCWMAWPCRRSLWGAGFERAQRAYAAVANAIADFEPVTMLVLPEHKARAAGLCAAAVELLEFPLDDSWTRDTLPNFVVNSAGEVAGSLFQFNAWGGKYTHFRRDATLGHRLCEHLGLRSFTSALFMEGGGISVDGEGTVLTTQSCVLNANRNPRITKAQAEDELCEALGASRVLWIPGDPDDEETDGHVDGSACFVRPGVIMVEQSPSKGSRRDVACRPNLDALQGVRDAAGREIELLVIEEAHEALAKGDIFCSSYINFYVANGGVVMPGYGISRDRQAQETVQAAFPDREVVQVPINDIACGGGAIHCITQQQPLAAV